MAVMLSLVIHVAGCDGAESPAALCAVTVMIWPWVHVLKSWAGSDGFGGLEGCGATSAQEST